jgi:hypothetical protein
MSLAAEFMSAILNAFEANKRPADRAVEQVPHDKLRVTGRSRAPAACDPAPSPP